MENNTIRNLGKLYHLLDEACTPDHVNQADLDNAARFPVRGVTMKITLAHKLHKMTPELDNACSCALKDVDIEDAEKSYSLKALPMEQRRINHQGLGRKNRAIHCNHSTCRVRQGSLESVYPQKDRSRLRRYHR